MNGSVDAGGEDGTTVAGHRGGRSEKCLVKCVLPQVGEMMGCTLEQARAAAAEADTAAQMARAFEVRPTDLSHPPLGWPPLPSCFRPHPARRSACIAAAW